jgi:hypothetical protein
VGVPKEIQPAKLDVPAVIPIAVDVNVVRCPMDVVIHVAPA